MRLFLYTLYGLLILIVLLFLVSFALPLKTRVERKVQISGHPIQAFRLVDNLRKWPSWCPWLQNDTAVSYEYSAVDHGVNSNFTWSGTDAKIGDGSVTLFQLSGDSLIGMYIQFGRLPLMKSLIHLSETSSGTNVYWEIEADGSDASFIIRPFIAYYLLFTDRMLGPDLELAINNWNNIIKNSSELFVGKWEAEIRKFNGSYFAAGRSQVSGDRIGSTLEDTYRSIITCTEKESIKRNGFPFSINHSLHQGVYDISGAWMCSDSFPAPSGLSVKWMPPSDWLIVKYYGPYEEIGVVYEKAFAFIALKNWQLTAAPMEFYLTDTKIVTDPAKWYTEVAFPVNR